MKKPFHLEKHRDGRDVLAQKSGEGDGDSCGYGSEGSGVAIFNSIMGSGLAKCKNGGIGNQERVVRRRRSDIRVVTGKEKGDDVVIPQNLNYVVQRTRSNYHGLGSDSWW